MKKLLFLILILPVLFLAGCSNQNVGAGRTVALISASTATTTSSAIGIKEAKKVTLFLTTNIPTAGKATTTFTVAVSEDGTNYTTFNRLIDNMANTISQNLTRVASKVYDATSTAAIISLDLADMGFNYFKVTATQTFGTNGRLGGATVRSLIEF